MRGFSHELGQKFSTVLRRGLVAALHFSRAHPRLHRSILTLLRWVPGLNRWLIQQIAPPAPPAAEQASAALPDVTVSDLEQVSYHWRQVLNGHRWI